MRELPPDLAAELLTAVREICRADGAVPRSESRALEALARRLAVTVDAEVEFYKHTTPRELAERVTDLLARGATDEAGLNGDELAQRLARMAEEAATADGNFAAEEREALAAFVRVLERVG